MTNSQYINNTLGIGKGSLMPDSGKGSLTHGNSKAKKGNNHWGGKTNSRMKQSQRSGKTLMNSHYKEDGDLSVNSRAIGPEELVEQEIIELKENQDKEIVALKETADKLEQKLKEVKNK